jgi:hypothetical protein
VRASVSEHTSPCVWRCFCARACAHACAVRVCHSPTHRVGCVASCLLVRVVRVRGDSVRAGAHVMCGILRCASACGWQTRDACVCGRRACVPSWVSVCVSGAPVHGCRGAHQPYRLSTSRNGSQMARGRTNPNGSMPKIPENDSFPASRRGWGRARKKDHFFDPEHPVATRAGAASGRPASHTTR